MLNRGAVFDAWRRILPNVQGVTFFSRGGLVQGDSGALGPDSYFQYAIRAAKKKYKQEEADLSTVIAPSGDLVFEVWQEFMDAAVPLFGAPLPMPAPQIEDYLVDVTGAGWTVSKVNPRCLFDVVYELTVINRNVSAG